MTLGEKLKQVRLEKGFSQPELAQEADLEQSYLSKLENDKSLPSNEVFRKLLAALQLTVEEFVTDELVQSERNRLKQVPDIENLLVQKAHNQLTQRRRFLFASSLSIVVAITLFFVGYTKLIFNEYVYHYESIGIIKEDEPLDIFSRRESYYLNTESTLSAKERKAQQQAMILEMAKRKVSIVYMTNTYKGPSFTEKVVGGKRLYKLDDSMSKVIRRPVNSWLQVFGVLLFSGGVMGFFLERRLFKPC